MTTPTPLSGTPPRFLTDVNFNNRIVTGLRRRAAGIDAITVQDLGLREMPDPQVLLEARALDRILLTHDVNIMPMHFTALLASLLNGEHSPGIMLIAQDVPIGVAIQELYQIWACSSHEEWRDQATYIPL